MRSHQTKQERNPGAKGIYRPARAAYNYEWLERAGWPLADPTGSVERKVRALQGTVVGNAHRPRNGSAIWPSTPKDRESATESRPPKKRVESEGSRVSRVPDRAHVRRAALANPPALIGGSLWLSTLVTRLFSGKGETVR